MFRIKVCYIVPKIQINLKNVNNIVLFIIQQSIYTIKPNLHSLRQNQYKSNSIHTILLDT